MSIQLLRRKLFVLLFSAILLVTLYALLSSWNVYIQLFYYFHPKHGISCYRIKTTNSLQDVSEIEPPPEKGRSIFFHETSCTSHYNAKITITSRQACAVESAARLNPNYHVYLLFTSPGQFQFDEATQSDRLLQALLTYGNIKIHHLDYETYTRGTPVEELYRKGSIDYSDYAQSHASDVLRYLTLWKYGGIYLDLDVIVIRPLESLPANYAGAESANNVAAGVLSFSPDGLGHEMARACLDDLKDNFNGKVWGYNGPGVITRLLKKRCGVSKAKDMLDANCDGFTVYPTGAFYAVPWWNWSMYFDESATNDVMELSKNSYVMHVWNKHSVNSKINVDSNVPYLLYAKKYCPKVYRECREHF